MSAELNSTTGQAVVMDRDALQARLCSADAHKRLLAAREYERFARIEDTQFLRDALAREEVTWVKAALSRAIGRIAEDDHACVPGTPLDTNADESAKEIYANAVEDTTRRLVHEIEPVLGTIRIYAKQDIEDFDKSQTKLHLDRLTSLIGAIGDLSRAASSPRLKEIDLSELVRTAVEAESATSSVQVDCAGRSPLMAVAEPALLGIVITNGLRNAVEASTGVTDEDKVVTVSWGDTDRDYWIVILDRGPGPPAGLDRVWDIGSTTKKGHLGMGLALSRQAAQSLGGTIALIPADGGGARFEFRWPLVGAPAVETSTCRE